ncbi:MAG TPA: ABC transporter permease [Phycisphaerae bacterium]|nr:ABC transporter permease [Phycisphaerales bacterium]HRX84744.1 ABC transporter permease [Phycisphaerae bacterium]
MIIRSIGGGTINALESFGRFWTFAFRTVRWIVAGMFSPRNWRLIMPQFYEIGNRSVPVIAITGTFVGLVLAVQAYDQLDAAGFADHMGVLINVTLVQELGPVLAAVMLAGRVGGALTAELGTMNVTEQIDALRVMGADPIQHLVVPRFLACLLLAPVLTLFADVCGSLSGAWVAIMLKGIPTEPYYYYTEWALEKWDLMVGFIKSMAFGGIIGMLACYKGFNCRAGAEGVGRACTEAFVASFIAILIVDFCLATSLMGLYRVFFGFKSLV